MQMTMKKVGAAVIAAMLFLVVAPALALSMPGEAHAAGKVNLVKAGAYVEVETLKYDTKTGDDIFLAYKGGKAVKPKVTVEYCEPIVYDADGNYVSGGNWVYLKKNKDFTVTYKNNKNVGTGYVIVKGKGKFTGTIYQPFDIYPSKITGVKAKGAKKSLKVSWKAKSAKQADGYIVSVYTRGDKYTQTINGKKYTYYRYYLAKQIVAKGSNAKNVTVKGLKGKTKYYVKVNAYKSTTGSYKITRDKFLKGKQVFYTANHAYAETLHGTSSTGYKVAKTK